MWYSYRELIYRVGTFFLLVGFVLIMLFVLTEDAGQVVFSYFCWGTILLVIGFLARNQYRKSIDPSGRFGILKRFRPKSKQDKGK